MVKELEENNGEKRKKKQIYKIHRDKDITNKMCSVFLSKHNKREEYKDYCKRVVSFAAMELGKASQICFEEAVMAHVGLKAF